VATYPSPLSLNSINYCSLFACHVNDSRLQGTFGKYLPTLRRYCFDTNLIPRHSSCKIGKLTCLGSLWWEKLRTPGKRGCNFCNPLLGRKNQKSAPSREYQFEQSVLWSSWTSVTTGLGALTHWWVRCIISLSACSQQITHVATLFAAPQLIYKFIPSQFYWPSWVHASSHASVQIL
jgi:hypothetical protein